MLNEDEFREIRRKELQWALATDGELRRALDTGLHLYAKVHELEAALADCHCWGYTCGPSKCTPEKPCPPCLARKELAKVKGEK